MAHSQISLGGELRTNATAYTNAKSDADTRKVVSGIGLRLGRRSLRL